MRASDIDVRSEVTKRIRRRRSLAALSALLGTAVVLGAGDVGARPVVDIGVPSQASPTDGPGQAAPGSGATVSGDGRFIAYFAAPGNGDPALAAADGRTSTVYLTDREAATTVEVTVVPDGQRPGNTIHPVLSGDGCSIVVVTELALDVFRDDDTGLRWDVYRQRLEHCGGLPGNWELVSTRADGSAVARDDVVADRPAVSRSGTLIAYTHPATDLLDAGELTTISLVDLIQPVGSPDRSRSVAGMPITSPNTEFVHGGIDQPALSGDGRFVAYRSDAASTDAVPGWGFGQVAGGPATAQIFVWDREQPDPFEAVKLVSVRVDELPTMTGASQPTLSRDGRVVAFTSSDVGLVPAVFPPCADVCPSQVYHLDRDVDGNGLYDEPTRTKMSLASSEPGTTPLVAGTAPSSQPSLSADGQLVAFITKATNLQLVEVGGGGDESDGDLLVADVVRNTLRRVATTDGDARPAAGSHARPQLSDTGRTIVLDTLVGGEPVTGSAPGRQVIARTSPPKLSLAEGDLGTTLVGFTSDEWYVAVNNDGPTTFTPSSVSISDGRFRINHETSTCGLGAPVPPGGGCTVRLTFTPSAPGPVTATLTVAEEGFQAVSVSTTVRGAGGDPMLRTNPAGQALGSVVVGQASAEFLFDVENISLVPTSVASIRVVGPNPDDFVVTSNSCEGRSLNPRSTCSIGVTFVPKASGQRSAVIELATPTGQYTVMVPDGTGRYEPKFEIDRSEVEAGREFGVGGGGFPPSTPVSILFGDDPANRIELVTDEFGGFLALIPTLPDERGGNRTVVAQAADGSAAASRILVIERPDAVVGLPGFGLG